MTEIGSEQLWVPGQGYRLSAEHPVPPTEELQAHWQAYLRGSDDIVVPAPGVYGVVRALQAGERPRAYASVDLCEVVRTTSLSMRKVEEPEPRDVSCIHCYGHGLSVANDIAVVQVLMSKDLIAPTKDVDAVASQLRHWRALGVYVVANTSTLPGCELGTIRFLRRYMPGAFDGLLLPRNHEGTAALTKGVAARQLLQAFGEDVAEHRVAAVHIDDVPHHNIAFRKEMRTLPRVEAATFQPQYPTHFPPDDGAILAATPLEAFARAHDFLLPRLR